MDDRTASGAAPGAPAAGPGAAARPGGDGRATLRLTWRAGVGVALALILAGVSVSALELGSRIGLVAR